MTAINVPGGEMVREFVMVTKYLNYTRTYCFLMFGLILLGRLAWVSQLQIRYNHKMNCVTFDAEFVSVYYKIMDFDSASIYSN